MGKRAQYLCVYQQHHDHMRGQCGDDACTEAAPDPVESTWGKRGNGLPPAAQPAEIYVRDPCPVLLPCLVRDRYENAAGLRRNPDSGGRAGRAEACIGYPGRAVHYF